MSALNNRDMSKAVKILKWTMISVLFVFLFGYITKLLWNWLLPSIFNLPTITMWQALGLLLLSKILFSGFSGKRWGGPHNTVGWKHRYYEKMSHMSPEEKERFKARVWEKWCSNKNSEKRSDSTSNV
jgi:hypothetical protein